MEMRWSGFVDSIRFRQFGELSTERFEPEDIVLRQRSLRLPGRQNVEAYIDDGHVDDKTVALYRRHWAVMRETDGQTPPGIPLESFFSLVARFGDDVRDFAAISSKGLSGGTLSFKTGVWGKYDRKSNKHFLQTEFAKAQMQRIFDTKDSGELTPLDVSIAISSTPIASVMSSQNVPVGAVVGAIIDRLTVYVESGAFTIGAPQNENTSRGNPFYGIHAFFQRPIAERGIWAAALGLAANGPVPSRKSVQRAELSTMVGLSQRGSVRDAYRYADYIKVGVLDVDVILGAIEAGISPDVAVSLSNK